MVFQYAFYYMVDRLLTGLTAQQKGTTAQWYSNKTFLLDFVSLIICPCPNWLDQSILSQFFSCCREGMSCIKD